MEKINENVPKNSKKCQKHCENQAKNKLLSKHNKYRTLMYFITINLNVLQPFAEGKTYYNSCYLLKIYILKQ